MKELFMIHCYQGLVGFITDFRKTWSGKLTRYLLKESYSGLEPYFESSASNQINQRTALEMSLGLYDQLGIQIGQR